MMSEVKHAPSIDVQIGAEDPPVSCRLSEVNKYSWLIILVVVCKPSNELMVLIFDGPDKLCNQFEMVDLLSSDAQHCNL